MASIIGFVSQKGGVGKSTLSRLLAREYTAAGWSVKIADLDVAQGTSFNWQARRQRRQVMPDIAVERFRSVQLALKVAPHYDLMILDQHSQVEFMFHFFRRRHRRHTVRVLAQCQKGSKKEQIIEVFPRLDRTRVAPKTPIMVHPTEKI